MSAIKVGYQAEQTNLENIEKGGDIHLSISYNPRLVSPDEALKRLPADLDMKLVVT